MMLNKRLQESPLRLTPTTAIDILFSAGLTRNTPDFRLMVSLPVRC